MEIPSVSVTFGCGSFEAFHERSQRQSEQAILVRGRMKVSRNMPLLWSLELVWGPEAINMALLRSLKIPFREPPGGNDTRALPVYGHIANRRNLRPMIKSQCCRIVA